MHFWLFFGIFKLISLCSELFLRYIAIQEQEPEFYEKDNKLLNFIKLRGLGLIVKYIRHSQVGLFPIEEVDYLQAYLRNHMQHLEEEQLIKLSHGVSIIYTYIIILLIYDFVL